MAASFLTTNPALQQALAELTKSARPGTVADLAALGVFVLGSAGYLLKGYTWDRPDPCNHIWYERPQLKAGGDGASSSSNARKETRNIAKKLDEAGKDLVVFWGSQSGTAEAFATRLARECHVRFGIEAMAADLSDFDAETVALMPQAKLAVFIMATFGEGDPSDNAHGFWDFLHKRTHVSLANLRYFALGLGNSNYKHYNRVIDVVGEALDKAGAKAMMAVGKANDAEGQSEEDFMAWKDELFGVFKTELGFVEHEILYEPSVQAEEDESLEPIDLHHGEPVQQLHHHNGKAATTSPIRALTIQNARELFTSRDRNCIHMELDLTKHPELVYKTGDHLAVWPTNPDQEVARLLRVLGRADRADVPLVLKSLDATLKLRVPSPTTTAALLRHYLEICAPVSRDALLGLAAFAPSAQAKAYLLALGRDRAAYADVASRTALTVGRVLELASSSSSSSGGGGEPWTTLPLSLLVETLPAMQPRYYSISSSSVLAPRHAAITALVSRTPLPNSPGQAVHGLATNHLFALSRALQSAPHPHGLTYTPTPSDTTAPTLHAHIRKSRFKLPALGSTPLIMAAAGTGLAPFRAFVAERARLRCLGKPVGPMLLFFGCRHPDEDFIYREELAQLQKDLGGVLEIVTAFSRLEGQGKTYVQDRVKEHRDGVLRLLDQGAGFYVCGRASMARAVGAVVAAAMAEREGWGEAEAREWSERARRRGKWLEDVWG